jgi:hypothetical protein
MDADAKTRCDVYEVRDLLLQQFVPPLYQDT